MESYIVTGGNRLSGEIKVQGSKNSVLPILAAAILNKGKTVLHNCPDISDVKSMINILDAIGCKVDVHNGDIEIDASEVTTNEIPHKYVKEMRSSIIVLGALLGRLNSIKIAFPGGCSIGKRPIDYHIRALKTMNAEFKENNGIICCETEKLVGSNIHLYYPSVGATENIMLAAVLAKGVTHIVNAAREPEIIELENFLNCMGAKIRGSGTNHIIIYGVEKLKDVEYSIRGDRIVAGTYMAAAAITNGELAIKGTVIKDIDSTIGYFRLMGCEIKVYRDGTMTIKGRERLKAINMIETRPFPGFPTDMQALSMACLSVADGGSLIYENIFENRYKHVNQLIKMGADIITKKHCAFVKGVDIIRGNEVYATDLRGGAALLIAGLVAEGETRVYNIHHIKRGYEDIVENINLLGGKMKSME